MSATSDMREQACQFDCDGDQLIGVFSPPDPSTAAARQTGVVLLVGGAQYRNGSHRQFALLARAFAAAGSATLRFDVRGMGDSDGAPRDFSDTGRDIACAIDQLLQCQPTLDGVVLWGLCDGASAGLLHAAGDARVKGLVLVNPWARSDAGQAQAYIRHYYGARLLSADLWRKIASGRFNPVSAVRSLLQQWWRARGGAADVAGHTPQLPERLLHAYGRFHGPVLTILSEHDLTAREYDDLAVSDSRWAALRAAPGNRRLDLAGANHTFSTQAWRDQVAAATIDWLRQTLP